MNKYIGKRFLQLIPVLLGITFLSFAMMRAAGSDAIIELYGDKGAVAQEIIDAKRAELGLDQPFLTQYGAWLRGLLTGNMGVSYVSGKEAPGDAAADGALHRGDRNYFHSAGHLGGGEAR